MFDLRRPRPYDPEMMKVIRGASGTPSDKRADNFTGDVWRDTLLPKTNNVSVGNVFFAPSSRTYWHTHVVGQLLIVLVGEGYVCDEDGAVRVRTGDAIWTPPGVRHWHGASTTHYMLHTAVTIGAADWHEPVSEDDYAAATATDAGQGDPA